MANNTSHPMTVALYRWQCFHYFLNIFTDDVPYIWTSGRLCDFKGCESRKDLEPKNVLGWFWSANREKIQATNQASIRTMLYPTTLRRGTDARSVVYYFWKRKHSLYTCFISHTKLVESFQILQTQTFT